MGPAISPSGSTVPLLGRRCEHLDQALNSRRPRPRSGPGCRRTDHCQASAVSAGRDSDTVHPNKGPVAASHRPSEESSNPEGRRLPHTVARIRSRPCRRSIGAGQCRKRCPPCLLGYGRQCFHERISPPWMLCPAAACSSICSAIRRHFWQPALGHACGRHHCMACW